MNNRPLRKCRNHEIEKFKVEWGSLKRKTHNKKPKLLVEELNITNYKIISDLALEDSLSSRCKCKVCGLSIDKSSKRLGLKGFRRLGGKTFPSQIWAHPQCCASFESPNSKFSVENDSRKKPPKTKCEFCAVSFCADTENVGTVEDKLYICVKIGYVRRLFCSACFRDHITSDTATEPIDLGIKYTEINNFHSLNPILQDEVCTLFKGS